MKTLIKVEAKALILILIACTPLCLKAQNNDETTFVTTYAGTGF